MSAPCYLLQCNAVIFVTCQHVGTTLWQRATVDHAKFLLLPVFIRFYLWRPTWVLDIWNEDIVCVRMSGGWPHFLDRLCKPVWGLKAEHLAVTWKVRAREWMVALKGQTPSREKCCKKQTKHNGKENLTEHNRSVSGGTLTWRTR